MLKAAQKNAIPPSVLLFKDRQPSDGWSPVDKKLIIAFQILEDETCPDCGIPVWIGHSDDDAIVFNIKSRICYACAEIETRQEQQEKQNAKRNRRPTKGKKSFLTEDHPELHPSREKFYEVEAGLTNG